MKSFLFLVAFLLASCSSTQVQREATAANAIADTFNRSLPVWVHVAETECDRAVDNAVDFASADRAAAECEARWRLVSTAWESARLAHGTWRSELLRCEAQGTDVGDCQARVDTAFVSFTSHLMEWRCAVRHNNHPELDIFPSVPLCPMLDGGTFDAQ